MGTFIKVPLLPVLVLLLQQSTFGFVHYQLPRNVPERLSISGSKQCLSFTSRRVNSRPLFRLCSQKREASDNGKLRNIRPESSSNPPKRRPPGKQGGKRNAIERNKKIVAIGQQRKWKELLNLYQNESNKFNNVNYATTMSQLQRIRSLDRMDPLFLKFVDDLAAKIEERGLEWIGIRQISNIAHAIGKMRLRTTSAQRIVEFTSRTENAKIMVEEGSPQNVANTAWACATLGFQSPKLFSEIERRASWLVKEGTPQAVANTAWACATLGFQSPRLFSEIERRASWLVEDGKEQEVANTAWACATLGFQSPRLFSEIVRRASWLVEEGTPQAVANTAWAFASLGFQSPRLFTVIERRASWLVEDGKPQEVANTAWACATLGFQSPKLFSEIERRASWLVKEGNPQAVANTAWACATLGFQSPRLFSEIDRRASWLVEEGNPQNIANTARACATLGVQTPRLFSEIERRASWLVEEGTPQAVANTALAFATLGIQPPHFFECASLHFERILESSNEQNIANLCYAIAILDLAHTYEREFSQLWSKTLSWDPRTLLVQHSRQLAQVYAFVKASGMDLQQPAMLKIKDSSPEPSRSQREVSLLLNELGFDHEEEVHPFHEEAESTLPLGMLSIDMACRDRMVAIEFDGPSHFLIEAQSGKVSKVENGATKAKRLFLERLGWNVFNVRYADWDEARGEEDKKELLRAMLNLK
jgi:hypothetical protein